jgi:CRISPR system Cascade subunit CasA
MPACAAALTGCQAYTPQPLDAAAHEQAWRARDPSHEGLRDFAAKLNDPDARTPTFDPSDGLTLAEAQVVALYFNADLREARARADAAAAPERFAGLWDDLDLSADVNRVLESTSEPWVFGGSLSLTIPVSGRLGAEKALSEAERLAAQAAVARQESELIDDLRRTWIEWSAETLRAEIAGELTSQLQQLVENIGALEGEDELSEMETRLFQIEWLTRRNDARAHRGRAAGLELALKGKLGLKPDAPVTLNPELHFELEGDSAARLAMMRQRNLTLAERRADYEQAERALALEIRRQYPDVTIGPSVEREDEQTRVGFSGSMPLIFFNRNRAAIARAVAERAAARAAFEASLEHVADELAQAEVEWQSRHDVREEYESSILPLIEEQADAANQAIESGDFDAFLQLDSIVRLQEGKLQLIDLLEEQSLSAIRIGAVIGFNIASHRLEGR